VTSPLWFRKNIFCATGQCRALPHHHTWLQPTERQPASPLAPPGCQSSTSANVPYPTAATSSPTRFARRGHPLPRITPSPAPPPPLQPALATTLWRRHHRSRLPAARPLPPGCALHMAPRRIPTLSPRDNKLEGLFSGDRGRHERASRPHRAAAAEGRRGRTSNQLHRPCCMMGARRGSGVLRPHPGGRGAVPAVGASRRHCRNWEAGRSSRWSDAAFVDRATTPATPMIPPST